MSTPSSEIGSRRLDLAGTRDFAVAGAGRARREALSAFNRDWLAEVWRAATGGTRIEGVALAAVGSLGRADAGPLSDYDLVLLHSERSLPAKELTALADRIWYPIWDAGVRLDHSVRTVTQCRQVAAGDLIAAVGLLDLAPLAGDEQLVAAARSTVAHDWRGNARKRLPSLVEALAARHQRQGDLAQSIEPELKEAHGGLRDMTVLSALAEAWLADRPHGGVDAAHAHLLDVRDAVHVVTGRGRDRLGREDHDAVAALLGHDDADDLLTSVSAAGRLIAYALDGTLRRAGQSQRARTLRVGPRRPQMTPLGHGLFASDGEVVLGSDPARRDRPGDADARRGRGGPRGPAHRARDARQPGAARAAARGAVAPGAARPVRRPPRVRPGPRHRVGGPGPGRHRRHLAAGVVGRAIAAAAQRRAPAHRRPAPRRDRRAGGRARAPGLPTGPAARRRPAARHRQGPGRPRPLARRRRAHAGDRDAVGVLAARRRDARDARR